MLLCLLGSRARSALLGRLGSRTTTRYRLLRLLLNALLRFRLGTLLCLVGIVLTLWIGVARRTISSPGHVGVPNSDQGQAKRQ